MLEEDAGGVVCICAGRAAKSTEQDKRLSHTHEEGAAGLRRGRSEGCDMADSENRYWNSSLGDDRLRGHMKEM
jgi:hypothetical protein